MIKGIEASKKNKYLVIIPDNNMLMYNKNEEIIQKELEALKIIDEKNVNVIRIKNDQVDLVYYNWKERKENQLTQEEYDLLREVLCEKLQEL